MGKECGAWVSRRLWGGGNTSPLKTTAWEAKRSADDKILDFDSNGAEKTATNDV